MWFPLLLLVALSSVQCTAGAGVPPRAWEHVGKPVVINTTDYTYWCIGNCGQDVSPPTAAGVILMGGGTDVDDAFKAQIRMSGSGDFVVIRTYGDDAYNPYIMGLGSPACNTVATFLLKTRQASADAFVLKMLAQAEAVFIAGGDQAQYMTFWNGTALQTTLRVLSTVKNIPIGGTSAGCAVLGEFVYTAMNDTVESSDALDNPYDYRVTLGQNFLNLSVLAGVITDPHFVTRDRMGRLVTFMARLVQDGWTSDVRGIGIDEKTAVLVTPDGKAQLYGSSTAYFVLAAVDRPQTCEPNQPLTYYPLNVQIVGGDYGTTFDFNTWTGGVEYSIDADEGELVPSDPYSPPSGVAQ